jgi:uncharacterized membrane protein YphA (DoxX/SURF4 family)
MREMGLGRGMLGLSSIGLGGVLVWKGLSLPWRPLLTWPPTSAASAYVVGALLTAAGLGFLTRGFVASLGLGLGWLLLGLPVAKPAQLLTWYGVVEGLSFGCGGWILARAADGWLGKLAAHPASRRSAQAIFGLTLIFYGASHFLLLSYTASLIPPLFPQRLALAEFTGAAHIAAGSALVLGVVPRMAAILEAAMLTSFGLIVQIPVLIGKPAERSQWIEVLASFALAGAAWAFAEAIKSSMHRSDGTFLL